MLVWFSEDSVIGVPESAAEDKDAFVRFLSIGRTKARLGRKTRAILNGGLLHVRVQSFVQTINMGENTPADREIIYRPAIIQCSSQNPPTHVQCVLTFLPGQHHILRSPLVMSETLLFLGWNLIYIES